MYDTHCHILPRIDDGAKDIVDSLEICRVAAKLGVKEIIATPHFIDSECEVELSTVYSQINLINEKLESQNIMISVLPGMEIFITPDIVQLYEHGKIITLNCKNYMLIELPMRGIFPSYFEDVIFKLQLKGIRPIIAHPERYRTTIKNPYIVHTLIERGCIIQVNSGSLLGIYGKGPQKTAYKLLKNNLVHIISSDTHSSQGSIYDFEKCYNIVRKKIGLSAAQDLFVNNPYKIINGQDISFETPDRETRKKFIFFNNLST